MNILTACCARIRVSVTVLHTGTITQHYSVTEDFRNILRLLFGIFFVFTVLLIRKPTKSASFTKLPLGIRICWHRNRGFDKFSYSHVSIDECCDRTTGRNGFNTKTLFISYYAPPYAGGTLSDTAIRPSVCLSLQPRLWARWLPAAGRPPEMCGLRTRMSRTVIGGGHIVLPPPGGGGDSLSAVWWIDTPVARVSWLYMRPVKSACSLINHNATSRALTEY